MLNNLNRKFNFLIFKGINLNKRLTLKEVKKPMI